MPDPDEQHRQTDVPDTEQVPEPFRDLVDDDRDEDDEGRGQDPEKEEPTKDEAEVDDDDTE